jgi:nucleoside-diphosphate-sugar epimerase
MRQQRAVFVTGGTGYLGRALLATLTSRGHEVRALVRAGSERRLPAGVAWVTGDVLDPRQIAPHVAPSDTLVHLVGTPHPEPSKAAEFERVDLGSVRSALQAVDGSGVRHLVYVSVAQPAPVMKSYIAARSAAEDMIRESCARRGMSATILRPWYVLGPGHWWPIILLPVYGLAQLVPSMREGARRLGLVTHRAMVSALIVAVEQPADGVCIRDVPAIRAARFAR